MCWEREKDSERKWEREWEEERECVECKSSFNRIEIWLVHTIQEMNWDVQICMEIDIQIYLFKKEIDKKNCIYR